MLGPDSTQEGVASVLINNNKGGVASKIRPTEEDTASGCQYWSRRCNL